MFFYYLYFLGLILCIDNYAIFFNYYFFALKMVVLVLAFWDPLMDLSFNAFQVTLILKQLH